MPVVLWSESSEPRFDMLSYYEMAYRCILFLVFFVSTPLFGESLSIVYDSLDRVVSIQYPGGTAVEYAYDAAGNRTQRLVSLAPPLIDPHDFDADGDIDRDDLNVILAARNQPAAGADDPRDLDGDGVITALDARQFTLLCTRPRCAMN